MRSIINKKGSAVDIAFLIVSAIGLAIFVMVIFKVFPAINTQLKASAIGGLNESVKALDSSTAIATGLDKIFLTIFIGLTIAVFITSFRIGASPIMLPIYLVVMGLLLVISFTMQYVYGKFAENSDLVAGVTASPMMNNIMSHLGIVSIGIMVLSMILIFAKPINQGQGGAY